MTQGPPIVRLLAATTALSLAALGVGVYGALRPDSRAVAVNPEEVRAIRDELAELRRSVDLTRSQQSAPGNLSALADAERRLARLEANTTAMMAQGATIAPASASATSEPAIPVMADGTPRYTSFKPPSSAVDVRQLPGGALFVKNRDPALAGQSMVVQGRTADGRDQDITVTVPPPG